MNSCSFFFFFLNIYQQEDRVYESPVFNINIQSETTINYMLYQILKFFFIALLDHLYFFWDYTIYVIVLQFMKEHLFPFNTKLLYEVRTIYIYVECNEANYTRVLKVYRGIPLHAYIFFFYMACVQGRSLFSLNICICIISIISRTYVE